MKYAAEPKTDTAPRENAPTAEDLASVARSLAPLLNDLATEVFQDHKLALISQNLQYLVPAIWGPQAGQTTDAAQRDIRRRVDDCCEKVWEVLGLEEASPPQHFAINYLVRTLLLSKLAFQLEHTNHLLAQSETVHRDKWYPDLDTIGSA